MTTGNRWGRAVGAGVLAELSLIAAIGLAIFAVSKVRGPVAENAAIVNTIGMWMAMIGGPVLVYLFARWAVRPLATGRMAHAGTVAAVAVGIHILTAAPMVAQGMQSPWVLLVADTLKIVGGIAAGYAGARKSTG